MFNRPSETDQCNWQQWLELDSSAVCPRVVCIGKAKTKRRTIRFVHFIPVFRCVRVASSIEEIFDMRVGKFLHNKNRAMTLAPSAMDEKRRTRIEQTIEQSFIIIIVSEYYLRAYRVRSIDESKCLCIGEIKCFGFGMPLPSRSDENEEEKKFVIIIGCLLQFYFLIFRCQRVATPVARAIEHASPSVHWARHRQCRFTSCERDRQVNQCQTWLVTVIDVMSFWPALLPQPSLLFVARVTSAVAATAVAASHISCDMNEIFSIWLNFKLFAAQALLFVCNAMRCTHTEWPGFFCGEYLFSSA